MKKLLLALATTMLSAGYCTAQEMTLNTTKAAGERIQLTIVSDGGFTIEGVEGEAKEGFSGYTLTGNKVTLKGKVLEISAVYSSIDDVNVKQMPGIKTLDVFGNPITSLDLSANKDLENLIIGGTSLTSLDISNCTNLKHLNVNSCKIESIDFSKNENLEVILAKSAGLKQLNLNGLKSVDVLDCSYNNLGTLDLSPAPTLTQLSCAGNQLNELNVKGLSLMVLNCNANNLKTIDLSGQTMLQEIGCISNQIESLNLKDCRSLFGMMIYDNNIRHKAMTALVESMPTVVGELDAYFTVVDLKNAEEKNEMSKGNVKMLRDKNWEVYDYDGGSSFDGHGVVYEGEDDDKLSINDISTASFTVYATADNIYVDGISAGTEIMISDMSGAVIKKIPSESGVNIIPTSDMPSGVYLVKAGSKSLKVMVR